METDAGLPTVRAFEWTCPKFPERVLHALYLGSAFDKNCCELLDTLPRPSPIFKAKRLISNIENNVHFSIGVFTLFIFQILCSLIFRFIL